LSAPAYSLARKLPPRAFCDRELPELLPGCDTALGMFIFRMYEFTTPEQFWRPRELYVEIEL
jgi:hypothetical protein